MKPRFSVRVLLAAVVVCACLSAGAVRIVEIAKAARERRIEEALSRIRASSNPLWEFSGEVDMLSLDEADELHRRYEAGR
jgi:hypothetical protein